MTILNALLLTGTLAGGAGAPAPSLGPSSWVLTGFSGPRSFQTVRGDAPTLTLKGGTVSGNAGCNLYNGSLTVSGPRFKVGPLTTTRKLCDPITMRVENDYLRVLGAATSYRLSAQTQMSAQTLTLYAGKAGRLTFRAGGSAMTPPNRPAPKPSPTSPVPQPAQLLRNFRFFDAPHVAVVTSDAGLGTYGAVDCGGYVSTFLAAATALGVATCAQAALALYSDGVRDFLQLAPDRLVVCGIAFGYADHSHPANSYRTDRAALADAVTRIG